MWIADHWKDYGIIDTSQGEKLEHWGKYLLVRPDPQVIWNTPRNLPGLEEAEWHIITAAHAAAASGSSSICRSSGPFIIRS